jgi:hypothetical protein
MARSKLPKRFDLVGVAIAIGFMTFWLLDDKFNFFHLPTSEEVIASHANYGPTALYSLLKDTSLTLVPGIWLGVFTMDMGELADIMVWIIAASLNFPI